MNTGEVDKAVRVAKEAQKKWRDVPVSDKAEILYKAADLLEENKDVISDIIMHEVAKDKKGSLSEVVRTADFIRFTADTAKNITGESLPGESFPGFKKDKISIVRREPLGVVLAISPFNYPLNLAASKIAPAIMAGNSVVFKPATQGSITGIYLTRIFQMAGVPNGVINSLLDVLGSTFINWEERNASSKGYSMLKKYNLSKKDLKLAKENLDNALEIYKSQSKISWRKKLIDSKIPQWLL